MAFVTVPIGIIGEEEAAKILKGKGLRVIEHNWRMGHLEVDLIAENKNTIVFAEVKARTTTYSSKLPEEYVDEDKKRRILAAGNAYMKYHKTDKTPRFDIIGILVDPTNNEITYRNHLEGAFQPYTRTVSTGTFNGKWKWGHRNKTIGK